MSDLIKHLRKMERNHFRECGEAADELERLQAENERLRLVESDKCPKCGANRQLGPDGTLTEWFVCDDYFGPTNGCRLRRAEQAARWMAERLSGKCRVEALEKWPEYFGGDQ